MNDEQYFLANAYLDGELTADERRIAEADPEVMVEVEQLRALQDGLRDVPGPSAEARESAIGAAMAAFDAVVGASGPDDVPASEPAPHAAPVVPFRRRPAYAKLLGVAAALVAVAGLGIVVSQIGQSNDDDASDVADSAEPVADRDGVLTESVGESEEMAAELAPADDDAAADDAADDAGGVEVADEVLDADDGEVAAQPGADDSADMSTATDGDAAEDDTAPVRPVPDGFDPATPITDDEELGVYGAYLIGLRDAGELPPTPNHPCVEARHVLDEATLVLDDAAVPVYVDVREADGLVVAIRTDSCAEVLVGSLSGE